MDKRTRSLNSFRMWQILGLLGFRGWLSPDGAIARAGRRRASRAPVLGSVLLFLLLGSGVCLADAVTSFSLINADTDVPVSAFDPLPNGATLNLATLPQITVRANTSPATVGSVRFALDGNPNFQTENSAPYALKGDKSGNYSPWTPSLGSHTLTATPFAGAGATGAAGTALTITFTVVNQSPSGNQAPVANAGSDQSITLPSSATLSGSATDDGLPNPPATLSYSWSKFSGPGTVTFGNPAAAGTTASFSAAGTYTLRLTVSDSALSDTDDVVISVAAAGGSALPIRINSGGPAFTDSISQAWKADQNFTGGNKYSTTSAIAGTTDDTLYQTERYGSFSYQFPVPNGIYDVVLHFAEIFFSAAGKRVFDVTAEGGVVINDLDIWAAVGKNTATTRQFSVTVADGVLNLGFVKVIENPKVSAIEISSSDEGHVHPFLHVVIDAPPPHWIVDYDGNGSQAVALDGSGSHTHQIGRQLTAFTWKEGSTTLGTAQKIKPVLGVGPHTVALTIEDDNSPPQSLTGTVALNVFPINAVGGMLTQYYLANGTPLSTLIDALPVSPNFTEVLPTLKVVDTLGKIGGSPFTSNVVVALSGKFKAGSTATYNFILTGGVAKRLFVNGNAVSGPISLAAGTHALEIRFAINTTSALPAEVQVSVNGAAAVPIASSALTHDETSLVPFINSLLPNSGAPSGGDTVIIKGVGFFPSASVSVQWGSATLTPATVTPGEITLVTPPGSGSVTVRVQTPNGLSNPVTYTYTGGSIPISFTAPQSVATVGGPTQGAWGPDGRLYVGRVSGVITIYTFNDSYGVTATQTVNTVSGLPNSNILGIGFNPFDAPSPVKVYVAHSQLFANGGACFTGASAYSGQVSVLTGPSFTTVQPLITQLPVSNHDHGVNGLVFDNYGDLWIAQGGNTNAGVAGDCTIGQIPESPLSAGIVQARLTTPGFNGDIEYKETASGAPNNDQVFGEIVDVIPGVHVYPYSPGLRNPFDMVWTTQGKLYGTDNGPNNGFGPASLSATTQGPDPSAPDELLRLVEGAYYGHANRNRGRYKVHENVYKGPTATPILGKYTAPLTTLPSSSNGIDEYRATTFNSAMRGELLVQDLNSTLNRVKLSSDGLTVQSVTALSNGPTALDVLTGPGGAIIGIDYGSDLVSVSQPVDGSSGMKAYDIFPWRAKADGAQPFIIGGKGFGSLAGTTVQIGGVQAVLNSVSATRIKGLIPASGSPAAALLDVVVNSAGQASTITKAFRYLLPTDGGKGIWKSEPDMTVALGEVAAGAIDGVLYIVGQGNSGTLAYNIATEQWSTVATRPFAGNHHAAEVIDGKLYLFGGFGGTSEGKVQIYNPATNSWSTGAAIPFATGSAATSLINGKVYLAGGIVGGATVNLASVYNPKTNVWSSIASMPLGRNHTAAATDGQKMYVFGGRGPGSGDSNTVAIGFDDVQIYDPATNSWQCSCTNATIPPLPQKRGGMGKAVYHHGAFYVIGGETTSSGTGQVSGNVYNRVDVYNPVAKTWRTESVIPTGRHGIFPIGYDNRIFVVGGGIQAGSSTSKINENFAR